jgi:hypothetical protein
MRPFAERPETTHAGRGVLLMLGGVVVGAAVGLLTAPQSGERTRRRLVRRAEEAKAQMADLYDDVTDKVDALRRGVAATCAVGQTYLAHTRRELLGGPPRRQNPFSRLVHRLRG